MEPMTPMTPMRVGVGYDAHAFSPSRPLILGGVEIMSGNGLAGHSDGDVLSHAVADAILGAAGFGDLGVHFPAERTEPGISSLEILRRTAESIAAQGWRVLNVDVTVVIQHPPVAGYRDDMERRLAEALKVLPGAVNVKATTTDGLGFTGRGEGAAAHAVVLLAPEDGETAVG